VRLVGGLLHGTNGRLLTQGEWELAMRIENQQLRIENRKSKIENPQMKCLRLAGNNAKKIETSRSTRHPPPLRTALQTRAHR
jgi:hypothetical protein